MQTVTTHKVVSITYSLRNANGEIVEHSDMPVQYIHGIGGDLFPQVEQALTGKRVGEHVTVTLPPEEGFGHPDPGLTFTDDVENVPPELRRIGTELEAQNAQGETLKFVVTRIEGGKLTVDANHPFAGQTITFDVTVQDIRDATPDELRSGQPNAPAGPLQ
ncbi:MAG TPA: FKBP-type peptidyl-prolyl cis-trans isomerase [Acidiferrobacterales bacterium]|jgi:FKBP-type peptidyl-prolyl cis-trans isomerase SlyD